MSRSSFLDALAAFVLFVTTMPAGGSAQTLWPNPDPDHCAAWRPVPGDKPGTRRRFFPVKFSTDAQIRGSILDEGRRFHGFFEVHRNMLVSLISEPNRSNHTFDFVVQAGATIRFVYARHLYHVTHGTFSPFGVPRLRDIECITNSSSLALERYSPTGVRKPGPKPTPLTEVFREAKSRPEPTETPKKETLVDKFKSHTTTTSKPVDKLKPTAAGSKLGPALSRIEPAPSKNGTETSPVVCDLADRARLPVLRGTNPHSLQTVGVRNSRSEAPAYDYDSTSNEAFSVGRSFDIAESAGALIPYDTVAASRSASGNSTFVSLSAVDGLHANLRAATNPDPPSLLRLVIVGGAPEVSISGLAQVEAEIIKKSRSRMKFSVQWYAVDPTGAITPARHFDSLDKLVKEAASQAAGRRPDVLNARQLMTFFDDFERILTARSEPVEKVFWIKGAYAVPSAVPPLFETFISRISATNAVGRTPAGRVKKWLVLVTARMPGFSVSYLKEPIYSRQVGDVIEEADSAVSGPRRLIRDIELLATRLRVAAVRLPGTKKEHSSEAIRGELVFEVKDVFDHRGYLLSPAAVASLVNHLERVLNLLDDPSRPEGYLRPWAERTGKSVPTMIDILQNADNRSYPRLPNLLPRWAWKAVSDLKDDEWLKARALVGNYFTGANLVAREIARIPRSLKCRLYYVTEKRFRFGI